LKASLKSQPTRGNGRLRAAQSAAST